MKVFSLDILLLVVELLLLFRFFFGYTISIIPYRAVFVKVANMAEIPCPCIPIYFHMSAGLLDVLKQILGEKNQRSNDC